MPSLDPARVPSMHERVGGDPFFVTLVDRFYASVEADPRLRSLYPSDLSESKAHLTDFLIQYWGGPDTYSRQRGHPRLRMRHAPFAIGQVERDGWFEAMAGAVASAARDGDLADEDAEAFLTYFDMAATAMINQVT
jgi:hemoglobin